MALKKVLYSRVRPVLWSLALSGSFWMLLQASYLRAQALSENLTKAQQAIIGGDLAEAKLLLKRQEQNHPRDAEVHFLLGWTAFKEDKPKESLAEFTLGAKGRRPTAAEFRVIAADYVLLGDYADADHWFTEATHEAPQDANGWYLLGRTQYSEGRDEDAAASFRQVLTLDANNIKAEDNLGLSYQALNKLQEARAAFEKAIALEATSTRSCGPYVDLGLLLLQEDQSAEAMTALRAAVVLCPDNPKAHEELGITYKRVEDFRAARAELEKAEAIAPKASPVHFELGQVYRRLGLQAESRRELELCAELNATHSSVEVPNVENPQVKEPPPQAPVSPGPDANGHAPHG